MYTRFVNNKNAVNITFSWYFFAMPEESGKHPVLQARVSFEYKARFDEVLARLIARRGKTYPSDLVRILLGDEKKFLITDEERDYLTGDLDHLPVEGQHGPFRPRPVVPGRDILKADPESKSKVKRH